MPQLLRILVVLAFGVVAALLGGLLFGLLALTLGFSYLRPRRSGGGQTAVAIRARHQYPHSPTVDLAEQLDPGNPGSPLGREPIGPGEER